MRGSRAPTWARLSLLLVLMAPGRAVVADALPIQDITVWIKVYIPGEIPFPPPTTGASYTRALTKDPRRGMSVIPHPFEFVPFLRGDRDCRRTYATDQRQASPWYDASARLHIDLQFHADAASDLVTVKTNGTRCWPTGEFNNVTEDPTCQETAGLERLVFEPLEVLPGKDLGARIRVHGAVHNPCSKISRYFGDIDVDLTIEVRFRSQLVSVHGDVDTFPAYEAYYYRGAVPAAAAATTVGEPLFQLDVLPRKTATDLIGPATRRVSVKEASFAVTPVDPMPIPLGEHVPIEAENDVSGEATTKIVRGTSEFMALVENKNPHIVFKDEDPGTDLPRPDHVMTPRLRDRMDKLAILVSREWKGTNLRVVEAWDETNEHSTKSLHYEGRAADMTTSPQDNAKLGRLARLAVDAGFDWVLHENGEHPHVHASVRRSP